MPRIDLSRQAAKFVERLTGKHRRQVADKLLALMREPYPPDAKRLRGHALMRVDIGEYRIVYDIKDHTVRVMVIGKRNDDEVYRILGRKR